MGLRTVEFETSAYGDVYHNARLLTEQLVQHFNKADTGSISLICHSRGAIEACIAAMDSRLKDKIESIYGFAAPLFGSYLSTPILNLFRHRSSPPYLLLNCLGRVMGDSKPDSFDCIKELGQTWVELVDKLHTVSRTRFILIYSRLKYRELPLILRLLKRLSRTERIEGDGIVDFPKDGFYSFETVRLQSNEHNRVTHWSLTGLPTFVRASKVDPAVPYERIVKQFGLC
jgi:hypothetical protein